LAPIAVRTAFRVLSEANGIGSIVPRNLITADYLCLNTANDIGQFDAIIPPPWVNGRTLMNFEGYTFVFYTLLKIFPEQIVRRVFIDFPPTSWYAVLRADPIWICISTLKAYLEGCRLVRVFDTTIRHCHTTIFGRCISSTLANGVKHEDIDHHAAIGSSDLRGSTSR